MISHKWAASWQNQQNGCEPSEDSDQPGHPPSLIRVDAQADQSLCCPRSFNNWHLPVSLQPYIHALYCAYDQPQMSRIVTKPTKWLWTQWRLRSAWASAQSDQNGCPGWSESLLSAWRRILSYPMSTQRRLWSDWADAQTDLSPDSLHRAHNYFVGFVTRWLKYDQQQITVCCQPGPRTTMPP